MCTLMSRTDSMSSFLPPQEEAGSASIQEAAESEGPRQADGRTVNLVSHSGAVQTGATSGTGAANDALRSKSPAVECDTAEPEEQLDLASILLPSGTLPTAYTKFSVSYSSSILHGWVTQPSPCCAAASVAGAFNALLQRPRTDPRAFSHLHVLQVYQQAWDRAVESKKASFERKLGGGSIDPVIEALEARLRDQGQTLMSKGLTRTAVIAHITALVEQLRPLLQAPAGPEGQGGGEAASGDTSGAVTSMPRSAWEALAELLSSSAQQPEEKEEEEEDLPAPVTAVTVTEEGGGQAAVSEQAPADDEDEEDAGKGGEEGGEEEEAAGEAGKKSRPSSRGGPWKWRTELHALVKLMGSRQKLYHSKPSTGPIGNLALMRAVATLSATLDPEAAASVKARIFMGKRIKGTRAEVQLSSKDSPSQIAEQWAALRARFLQQDTVLLFHLTNHYALIFAMREWEEPATDSSPATSGEASAPQATAGVVVRRQVLTARRAQRPTAWIDFDEMRAVMLGWTGYKIMALKKEAIMAV